MKEDTIVALATPAGVGAISIIRISGNKAFDATDKFFSGKVKIKDSASHTIHYGDIKNQDGEHIDDVLVSVFKAPNSYTGEDSVEISTHGNPLITQKVIELLITLDDVRLAEPGEFTKRAFLNNRIDLAEAEAVADIINSRTEAAFRGARNQLDGFLSTKVNDLRSQLLNSSSFIELELDFAEEDIEFVNQDELLRRIEAIIIEIDTLLESYEFGKVIRDGVNVAIVGKPNVGKSSLLNYILKESRAIVSEIPGTTRDVIREEVSIDGILFRLFDTAGIRISEDTIEKEGILRSQETIRNSDLIIFLEDIQQGESKDLYVELLNLTSSDKVIKVLNKIDLDPSSTISSDVKISAKTGQGIDRLFEKLKEKTIGSSSYTEKTAIVTNLRHHNCLKRSRENLINARESILKKMSGEFISVDLRNAEMNLAEIIGEVTTDDILNNIFMKFCIGK
ncbi:MAG TPA: tRNA uridine-5-carboxymethylaminomethyl(34) synthesis GTPase MnmE [Ignavibacteriaceae bacterium]|nr:MAG: tRNA modification GTPase MnmE [Ignavibacteria bacterium ADurb.Bin266]OQY70516.1 MAG: tRNA uridine-5-carboxymethylaminomethyl(34) synthesis GTPase MnmE [Ignavibacteriales bacterium UTCHB2]HQF42072.1 tRNA uridine-5-carboxymethylaminomethyl(34) synthesis GTPase MnmE [Ignavibacteriaceae bacterium]HQI40724.1 tRNA uridine-5-carboxymethylaminomethyl(34) synthesis GTPase MnmE [Ignavibacteriaceae bacterium]HQJ46234.1 tRNA uridine-5-carboxymethylaminomethyl(34) synthesis GTPase MnmE [Ignavibacter